MPEPFLRCESGVGMTLRLKKCWAIDGWQGLAVRLRRENVVSPPSPVLVSFVREFARNASLQKGSHLRVLYVGADLAARFSSFR